MSKKIKGKKPGEFKKTKQKHQNVQHNRDQLKLLKESDDPGMTVKLFVLDTDGFKEVTIRKVPEYIPGGATVVYLQKRRNKTRLRTGYFTDKNGLHVEGNPIDSDNIYGLVVNTVLLKPSELNPPTHSYDTPTT